MERLTSLDGQDAVEAPAVGETIEASIAIGELVDEVPSEAIANIEVGIATIQVRPGAIARLSGVGNIVFAVTGGVDGVRPGVIECRCDAVPIVDAVAGL